MRDFLYDLATKIKVVIKIAIATHINTICLVMEMSIPYRWI
jgi:hypothetical protein